MTHDDEMDALLRDAARGYNEPPATPREEMWTRIAEARAKRTSSTLLPQGSRRYAGRVAAAAGIAAVLLTGVLIGRSTVGMGTAKVAGTEPGHDTARDSVQVAMAGADSTRARLSTPPENRRVNAPLQGSQTTVPPRRGQSPVRDVSRPRTSPEQSFDPQTAQRLYQLVALQHFGRTEQMLTAFRADARRGSVDARIAAWARDLLSTTRLLLDSPAAEDPQMRVLLGDLEVLLAKMAHLSGSAVTTDSKLIEDALGEGELMNRLRIAVPASAASEVQGE